MAEVSSSEGIPQPGDRIAGKYLVQRVLGAGGMGCVLAGEHTVLRMPVAIKVLLPHAAAQAGANERFLREAQAAAALRSENVARVLDMGTTERGAAFLVMEYLSGEDLREVVRKRGPLPIEEACEYLLQACDGVLEAHAQGIIHRDIKTANIFVTRRPNGKPLVKVLDFGLAKVLDPGRTSRVEDSITHTELVIGSPHYMSPEQFRSLRNADVRSDIWALGVVAYELFTGRRPFAGEGATGIMASVLQDEPERPRSLRADLPVPLDSLVMRCLEKTPARRPPWVAELIATLEPYSSSSPSSPSIQALPVIPPGSTMDDSARAPTHLVAPTPANSAPHGAGAATSSEAPPRSPARENERTDLSQVSTNPQRVRPGGLSSRWVYPVAILGACAATAAVTASLVARGTPAPSETVSAASPAPPMTNSVPPAETASAPAGDPGPPGSVATSQATSSATVTASVPAPGNATSAPTRKAAPRTSSAAITPAPEPGSPAESPSVVDPWADRKPKKPPR